MGSKLHLSWVRDSETQVFLYSRLDSSWDFWLFGLGCTSNFFLIHEKIENWNFYCCASWTFQLFPIHERNGKLQFVYTT